MIKVGIDIGNSKISSIVCDIKNDGSKKILSFISKPTTNVKKSFITNLFSIKNEILSIINETAKESQTKIKSINLNIPAVDSLSIFSNTEIQVAGEMITNLHLKKAINNSDFFETLTDYKVMQKFIVNYKLDDKIYYTNPSNNFGNILSLNFYKFAVKKNYVNTLIKLFNDININIENLIPTPLSSALATLNSDDKNLGAICIDLGDSSSSIAMFENNKLIFLDAIKIGSRNITNDIARGISTNIKSAERLKNLHGSVISSPSDEHELIEVPYLSSDPSNFKQINRNDINSIIKPRVEETLEMIWQKLKQYGLNKKKIKNLILTGGGSQLEGITDYAQIIFDSNVRLGKTNSINGLNVSFLKPQFSQTIGTILYDRADYQVDFLKNSEKIKNSSFFSQFSAWLDQYI
jgi:cell division protein FtsA